jgi:hypothetical protein
VKAALDLMLFLVGGLAVAGGTVAAGAAALCAVSGVGCVWWWRHRKRRGRRD